MGCPFPSLSESPRHALPCGGSLCPHECCRCRGRDDVLPNPMRREFAQAMCMWWTRWEQEGWPFPGGSSLQTERLKRVSRISNSHSEVVPGGNPLPPTRHLGGWGHWRYWSDPMGVASVQDSAGEWGRLYSHRDAALGGVSCPVPMIPGACLVCSFLRCLKWEMMPPHHSLFATSVVLEQAMVNFCSVGGQGLDHAE